MNPDIENIADEPKPVVLTPVDPPRRRGWGGGMKLQHMMLLVGVCAVLIWVVLLLGMLVFGLAFVMLLVILVGLVVILIRRAGTRKESMLWVLTIATERAMPQSDALLAFSDQFGRSYRWRAQFLASNLNEGQTLPEALERVPGAVSREAEVMIRTGQATGHLARSLRDAASLPSNRQAAWGDVASRFFYLGWLFFVMQLVSGFILYFIVPKFEAIFKDFGIPLPDLTIVVIKASHFVIGYAFLVFPLVGLLVILVTSALLIGVFNSYAMWLDIPLVDRVLWRRHSALVLRCLALAIGGHKPVTIVEGLADHYPSGWVKRRLARVADDIQQGRDWSESLEARGLIRAADVAVLQSAQRVGNLEWALRELADSSDRRLGYRLQFWLQLLFPLLVVAIGSLVMLFAVAYFLPLVSLIEVLAR